MTKKLSKKSERDYVCFTARRGDGKNFKPVKIKFYFKNKKRMIINKMKEIKVLLKEIEELI